MKNRIIQIIKEEPEFPGNLTLPLELYFKKILSDKNMEDFVYLLRKVVKLTKENIIKRIENDNV